MVNELVPYGIQNEKSSLRIHVCVRAGCLVIFKTSVVAWLVEQKSYPRKEVLTRGIVTAIGYTIPVEDIPDVITVNIPPALLHDDDLYSKDTGTKGTAAERLALTMIRRGWFPPETFVGLIDDEHIQIDGADIHIEILIQVKCDAPGGPRKNGGTGNVFIQIAERNPFNKRS